MVMRTGRVIWQTTGCLMFQDNILYENGNASTSLTVVAGLALSFLEKSSFF